MIASNCYSLLCPERVRCARWTARHAPAGAPLVTLFERGAHGLCANWLPLRRIEARAS